MIKPEWQASKRTKQPYHRDKSCTYVGFSNWTTSGFLLKSVILFFAIAFLVCGFRPLICLDCAAIFLTD